MTQPAVSSPMKRIADWKTRLIDLSRRNNLLYFQKSKRRTLPITQPAPQKIFDVLVLKKRSLEFWYPPSEREVEDSENIKPEKQFDEIDEVFESKTAKNRVAKVMGESAYPIANQLVSEGLSRLELEQGLKSLERRSTLDFIERGVRILYAVFGFLRWVDIETQEEVESPLVLVPLELRRETIRSPFHVVLPPVEDEAVLNPALLTKLKIDYKIDLPNLPEDWVDQKLEDYFTLVNQAVAHLGWNVKPSVSLGLFSFQKLVIYKDLEANAEAVIQHPIVRAISGIREEGLILSDLPHERDVDKIENPETTFQVLDADSSQRVSIEYALRGQSFVMKGPPGTGKSQTIANIIAECIANGKSVLFVSDKMAALEVVYKRLSEAGLAHFCLELHSSKANKQEVVAELKRSLDENLVPRRLPSADEFERMRTYREALNGYVAALHEKRPFLQKSVYDILSILSTLEGSPFVPLGLTDLSTLTPQKICELQDLVSRLSKVWQVVEELDFPWFGYRQDKYDLEIRSELLSTLELVSDTVDSLRVEAEAFSKKIGVNAPETFEKIGWLISVGDLLRDSPQPEAQWLTSKNVEELLNEATDYRDTDRWLKSARSDLMEHYKPSLFDVGLDKSIEIEQSLEALGKMFPMINLQESVLLSKRDKFSSFIKNTLLAVRKWRDTSKGLVSSLGLDDDNFSVEELKQLAKVALFVFAPDKPEIQWFDAKYLEQVKEIVERSKQIYQDFSLLKSRLDETYSDEIFALDLERLIADYNGPYKSGLKILNSNFRNDQKKLAKLTFDGKVPKNVLQDLIDAKKVRVLQDRIEKEANTLQTLLGHYYNKTRTDFNGAEKAIAIANEVVNLSWATNIPDSLIRLLTTSTNPSPMIKNLALELQNSVSSWEQQSKDLESLLPEKISDSEKSIDQTGLQQLEDWASEIEKHLSVIFEQIKQVIAASEVEPSNFKQLLGDLKTAEKIHKKETQILVENAQLQARFGERFKGLETDWDNIIGLLEWCKKVQAAFESVLVPPAFALLAAQGPTQAPLTSELISKRDASLRVLTDFEQRFTDQNKNLKDFEISKISERLNSLIERVDDLQVWIDFKVLKNDFALMGLEKFFGGLIEKRIASQDLLSVLLRGVYQEWINSVYQEDQLLGRFRRENHEQLIADFRKLDQELIRQTSSMVIEEANGRKPQDILIQAADTEAGILSKEAAKKRLLMPIRILFQRIPNLLAKLKPCLLMSPISVSQFLPSDCKFDLVLFDEASQLVPEDSIGAIYRGKTLVVAGDNKQLPPTSFFQKNLLDDIDWDEVSDEEVEVFDSILDECLGIGLPVKTLRWHYRSKHEDLIAFSNHRFYDDSMITFPSAKCYDDSLGVKKVYVPEGVYDRGGFRNNQLEAERVADLVFDHFKKYPKKTLGVVTFSVAQMEAVEEAIDRRLRGLPEFDAFFREDRLEGFFVKNLENVQGDERDVIFFSVGYGYDQKRQMVLNFGPLNKPGGERRLNVAVTRAREKIVLVSSIKASDINPNIKALGVQALRAYLDYAEEVPELIQPKPIKADFDSNIDQDVSEEIENLGYKIVPQVGCSGFKIDIGVLDPVNEGCFLLGVECDGTTYKSSSSARDRDRLREQVLQQLGWRIHRIWSPAWIARRESEIKRLKEVLEMAQKQQLEKEIQSPPVEVEDEFSTELAVQKNIFAGTEKIGVPYKVFPLKARYNAYIRASNAAKTIETRVRNQFHFPENRADQTRLLEELIQNEGPVHFDYAVQRIAASWGIKRVNQKVNHAVKDALNNLVCEQKVEVRGSFLWPVGLNKTPIRMPVRGIPETKRKAQFIAPEEIESAMFIIAQFALGISKDSLISETARAFGLNHSGAAETKRLFAEILERLIKDRRLLCSRDGVVSAA
jgi:hypothetical protein